MSRIAARDIARAALELAEARPEFVYQRLDTSPICHYVDANGGCLMGQAIVKAGVPVDVLALSVFDGGGNISHLCLSAGWFREMPDDGGTLYYLLRAQRAQDNGYAWGSPQVMNPLRQAVAS